MSADIIEEKAAGETAPAAAKSKKKLMLIGGAAAAVLLLGGGGAAFMLSGGSSAAAEETHEAPKAKSHQSAGDSGGHGGGHGGAADAYVDVPPMVVNLRSPDGAARFLKLHFMLVPGEAGSAEALKEQIPALLDAFQPFLRELRPEDLSGSAAVFRVKEELLRRSIETMGDGAVADVLIQDLIQQ